MGVLQKSGAFVSAKGLDAASSLKKGVTSEFERCQKAIASLTKAVAWSKEKVYQLYIVLISSLEGMIGYLSPFVTQPILWVKEQLVAVCVSLTNFVYSTFGKIDDSLVTPLYMSVETTTLCMYGTAKAAVTTQYSLVKNGLVVPAVNVVGNTVVYPVWNTASYVAKGATSKAINVGAYVDSKLSLVAMMLAVVEKTKKLDECVTKGAIEKKLVRPAWETATSLDSKFLGGSTQDLITSTVTQFQEAKGTPATTSATPKPVRTAAPAPVAAGLNTTSSGAPVQAQRPQLASKSTKKQQY
eukprot:g1394.t1